jgi:hypothetical protein
MKGCQAINDPRIAPFSTVSLVGSVGLRKAARVGMKVE